MLTSPKSLEIIGVNELMALLRGKFPEAELFMADTWYFLCHEDDIKAFLAQDQTNKIKYVPEEWDCDDAAFRLMGQMSVPEWSALTFGMVWTNLHALNCFVDENKEFWFVEPQTDEILPALKDWMGTKIRFITM